MSEPFGPRTELGQYIHKTKHRPPEESYDDSCVRYARTVAKGNKTLFRDVLNLRRNMVLLPAGRQQLAVGRPFGLTCMNCFVAPTIEDSVEGIFDSVKFGAMTMRTGGGVGWDFSTLRPNGELIRGLGSGAFSSGPISFMHVWNSMCGTIMSAGERRGAMMGVLRVDHPDILKFVRAKSDQETLKYFNISVTCTDEFMEAVESDGLYNLRFGSTKFGTIRALDVWAAIMENNWDFAEPGVLFIDRANRLNPLWYREELCATNPCITKDTWIHTEKGPRQVSDLIDKQFSAIVDGKPFISTSNGFFHTGTKPVFKLTTKEGYSLRLTDSHKIMTVTELSRFHKKSEWREVKELKPGDKIIIHNHSESSWEGKYTESQGYLLGLLIGDGTITNHTAVISVWVRPDVVNYVSADVVMATATVAAEKLEHRSDFEGFHEVKGRGEWRLSMTALKDLAEEVGMTVGNKTITSTIEQASPEFYKGFLRGFFDSDGSVQGSQEKGISIRLSQSDLPRLEAVQRMLLRFGIVSKIYKNRRTQRKELLPNGKGGLDWYNCQASHELVISSSNIIKFMQSVGFSDLEKRNKVKTAISSYKRAINSERFITEIQSIEPDGEEDVFDCTIPGPNAFDANGLYVHNCAEQWLPPNGACLLSSINVARLIESNGSGGYTIDFETLRHATHVAVQANDAVIDVSHYPLKDQQIEHKKTRRQGVGVTGMANALEICGYPYASKEYLAAQDHILREVLYESYRASIELAKKDGPFPDFDKEKYLQGEFVKQLPEDILDEISRYGIRNGTLTSIQPTGTISLVADNVSSGIEPVFQLEGERDLIMADGVKTVKVTDYAKEFYNVSGRTANEVSPQEHIDVLCRAQQWVDNSISKTCNVNGQIAGSGPGVTFDEFKDLYLQAYRGGAKSCTTFNLNGKRAGIMRQEETQAGESPGEACFIDLKTGLRSCE